MHTEWNDSAHPPYARERVSEMPYVRRSSSIRRSGRSSAAVAGSEPRGGSNPPPIRREEAPEERPTRVYGEIDLPEGPIYVRKPPERPTRASLQRKVSLNRSGPRLGVILLVVFTVLVAAVGSGWYYLTQSQDGQTLLAVWGWSNAPVEAYWRLGESKMREGLISDALEAFKTAYAQDTENGITNNIDGILALANAYERDGQSDEAIQLYNELIETIAPTHPEAYTRMYRMYKDDENHAEAVNMLELGLENTGLDTFTRLIREYSPDLPYASPIGGQFNTEVTVRLQAGEGATIYYTLDHYDAGVIPEKKSAGDPEDDDKNPLPDQNGIEYTKDTTIRLTEGTTLVRAVAVQQNGVPSKEMEETYKVVFPIPDPPSANVAPGTYDYAPTVALRSEKGIKSIHYTMDNTPATKDSPMYTGPIKLPNGRTYLRAVAVDHRDKVSYEMNREYVVKTAVKKMFNSNDAFDKLTLMRTTYDQFTRTYGKPDSYDQIGSDETTALYRAQYPFGYAGFIQTDSDKVVLYELMVESGNIKGPRSVKIGTAEDKALASFQDRGGHAMENGERLLYNNSLNSIGLYKLEEDGNFAAHYYYPRKDKKNEFVELSFHFRDGVVARMHWLWYKGDT